MKKKWETPKLVVLVRGRPEESILTACKNNSYYDDGPIVYDDNCRSSYYGCTWCSFEGSS